MKQRTGPTKVKVTIGTLRHWNMQMISNGIPGASKDLVKTMKDINDQMIFNLENGRHLETGGLSIAQWVYIYQAYNNYYTKKNKISYPIDDGTNAILLVLHPPQDRIHDENAIIEDVEEKRPTRVFTGNDLRINKLEEFPTLVRPGPLREAMHTVMKGKGTVTMGVPEYASERMHRFMCMFVEEAGRASQDGKLTKKSVDAGFFNAVKKSSAGN